MTVVAGGEERACAFVTALESDEILVVEDVEEGTPVAPAALLLELRVESRGEPTPPVGPLPLGPEASDVIDRFRFVLRWQLGCSEEVIDDAIRRVRALMPRGRR
jgi:hypothetical protein